MRMSHGGSQEIAAVHVARIQGEDSLLWSIAAADVEARTVDCARKVGRIARFGVCFGIGISIGIGVMASLRDVAEKLVARGEAFATGRASVPCRGGCLRCHRRKRQDRMSSMRW